MVLSKRKSQHMYPVSPDENNKRLELELLKFNRILVC